MTPSCVKWRLRAMQLLRFFFLTLDMPFCEVENKVNLTLEGCAKITGQFKTDNCIKNQNAYEIWQVSDAIRNQ